MSKYHVYISGERGPWVVYAASPRDAVISLGLFEVAYIELLDRTVSLRKSVYEALLADSSLPLSSPERSRILKVYEI